MEMRKVLERAIKYAEKQAEKTGENEAKDLLFDCRWFLKRCKVIEFGTEYVDFDCGDSNYDDSLAYVNLGETYAETICCEKDSLFIGSWGDWLEEKEKDYCLTENKVRCGNCGEYCSAEKDWHETECSCGYFVDGTRIPEVGSQLSNCRELYSWDSEQLFICDEKLPTHSTKSRQTTLGVRIHYIEDFDREWAKESKYLVSLIAVNPGIVKKKEREYIESSVDVKWSELSEEQKIEACIQYGTYATLWEKDGNSLHALLVLANEELTKAHVLGGFMLDAPKNAFGNSGWDFMAGTIGFK